MLSSNTNNYNNNAVDMGRPMTEVTNNSRFTQSKDLLVSDQESMNSSALLISPN